MRQHVGNLTDCTVTTRDDHQVGSISDGLPCLGTARCIDCGGEKGRRGSTQGGAMLLNQVPYTLVLTAG
jgi:hypothetical protein